MRCKACNVSMQVRYRPVPEIHTIMLEDLCGVCLKWAAVAEHNLDPDNIPVETTDEAGEDSEGGV